MSFVPDFSPPRKWTWVITAIIAVVVGVLLWRAIF